MTQTSMPAALPIGSTIAATPTGPRTSRFRVLGNSERGFQVWLSRDGLNWIPAGEPHTSYEDLANAFAESYPRPAEIHDAVFAAAFASKAQLPG
jgi:hypothetical protein